MKPIRCRSRVSESCYDGKDEQGVYGEDGDGQDSDGTWDGESVICDPCYIALGQPLVGSDEFVTGKQAGDPTAPAWDQPGSNVPRPPDPGQEWR